MRETNALRSIFGGRTRVTGYDEIQGYGNGYDDTVGVNWGEVGRAANLALNPVAQYHAIQNALRPPQPQQAAPPPGYGMPTAPQLPPNAVQAFGRGPARLLSYMGLGSVVFTPTSPSQDALLLAEPQASFRGRRLIISQSKTAGSAGIAVTINRPLTVSGMPQTPAPDQDAPVEMFAADATYSMLDLQIATSATQISLGLHVSSLPVGTGEAIIVTAGLFGEWIR